MKSDLEERLEQLCKEIERDAYADGLRKGLQVAEKITGWLNVQPPRKWAQEIRSWALAAIEKAKRELEG